MYNFCTQQIDYAWKFLYKKAFKYLLFCTCIGLIPYTTPLANTSKVCSGKFFVESIEIISPDGHQVDVQEVEAIKKIAKLPEKTSVKLPDDQLFRSASNRLFLQGYVVNIHTIEVEHSQAIKLQIRILQKLAKIDSITWEGIEQSEEEELLNIIPCKTSTFLVPYHKKEALPIIEAYFKQKGFPHIQVKLHETSATDNQTNLCFLVDKGEKIYVRRVVCRGNHHLPTQELTKQMPIIKARIKKFKHLIKKLCTWSVGLEGLGHIIQFFTGTPLVINQLDQDINWIKNYYQSKGFIDIAITYEVVYKEKGYADIILKIVEGPQYTIGNITSQGDTVYEDHALNKFLGIKSGNVFDLVSLQKKTARQGLYAAIEKFYDAKGYSLVSFNIKTYKNENNRVDLAIEIQKKPQLVINKIVIHKDLPIDFNVRKVLQQNGLQEGKAITHKKLESCRDSLIHTDLFVPEKILFIPEQEEDGKVDLICKLFVKRPQPIVSGGFEGWDGTASIVMPNIDIKKFLQHKKPCVGSQKLFLQFNQNLANVVKFWRLPRFLSDTKRKFALSFQDTINPFSNPITIGLDVFASPSTKNTQSEFTKGVAINTTTKWGSQTHFSELRTALGFHTIDVENIRLNISQSQEEVNENIKQCPLSIDYVKYKVNDLCYPTKGSSLSVGLKLSLSPRQALRANYGRLVGSYSVYKQTPLIPGWKHPLTIKWKSSAGVSSFDSTSPIGRFYLGSRDGEHLDDSLDRHYISLRGYSSKNIAITSPGAQYEGGSCFFMQSIEVRYPLEKSIPSYALLFIDCACSSQSLTKPLSSGGVSVGIGFRTKTPLGILGFDLAWPLVGEKGWLPKLHIQLGAQL